MRMDSCAHFWPESPSRPTARGGEHLQLLRLGILCPGCCELCEQAQAKDGNAQDLRKTRSDSTSILIAPRQPQESEGPDGCGKGAARRDTKRAVASEARRLAESCELHSKATRREWRLQWNSRRGVESTKRRGKEIIHDCVGRLPSIFSFFRSAWARSCSLKLTGQAAPQVLSLGLSCISTAVARSR